MKRALGFCLAAAFVLACGDRSPLEPLKQGPSAAVSDGAQATPGNKDFFFLPPMVPNPSTHPNFDKSEFNPNLEPEVQICPGTADDFNARCAAPVATFTMASGPGGVTVGIDVVGQQYHVNWDTDQFALVLDATYRVRVFVGSRELGFADVKVVSGGAKNAQTGDDIPLQDGRTLPIRFRIENDALCLADNPDFDQSQFCASATLGLNESVAAVDENGDVVATVSIFDDGGTGNTTTIIVRPCRSDDSRGTYLNNAFIDLPTYGECVDIDSDPPLSRAELALTAIATMCQAFVDAVAELQVKGLTLEQAQAQARELAVHNLIDEVNGIVAALPEADGDCTPPAGSSGLSLSPFDRLIKYASAGWQAVRERVRSWLTPGPLWASLVCDVGDCGGLGPISPAQAAVPGKMDYHADNPDGNLAFHPVGSAPIPAKVLVTDASGAPLVGATVRVDAALITGGGSVSPAFVTTGTDGIATFNWTLGNIGTNTFTVFGRGIADPSSVVCPVEGPLTEPCTNEGVFAPAHDPDPTDEFPGDVRRVTLGRGTLVFTATVLFSDGFETDLGWAGTGFWHRSTLTTNPPIVNQAFPTFVSTFDAPGTPGGTLPSPFEGTWVSWYAEEAHGNYIGTQVEGDAAGSGGISTAANSGTWTSPTFFVPTGGTALLKFNTWWEIESVNPASFDRMVVSIRDVTNGGVVTVLGMLNPAEDPAGGSPEKPFTSVGGFDAAPDWHAISKDVSQLGGHQVQVIFGFSTDDALYNGFRGWLVDNVQITLDLLAPSIAASGSSTEGGLNPVSPPGTRNP